MRGRVGGTEERGGEEERRVNERRYRTLTCFGLISAGCFVLKPLALIWGPQHLELIITHTPALLRLTVYTAITSTPIQTLYSLCAGTYCYTGVCIAVVVHLHKMPLHDNVSTRLNKEECWECLRWRRVWDGGRQSNRKPRLFQHWNIKNCM